MFNNNEKRIVLLTVVVNLAVLAILMAASFLWLNQSDFNLKNQGFDAGPGDNKVATIETDYQTAVIDVVQQANPAVVSIVVTKDVPVVERYFKQIDPFGGFGSGFGFQIPQYRENGTEKKEIGGGSGFFVSADGLVVTNRHVVADSEASYTVFTNEGEKYDAQVLARDSFLDIAVLQIKAENLPFLTFGDSNNLELGQGVVAIGNALGEFRNSVSAGIVSGLSRAIVASDGFGDSELLEEVIQTDAAINRGNSGGPLLNLSGEVIGVNVAVANGSENIGFALPADVVASVVTSVAQYGEIVRPYVGVRYIKITEQLAARNGLAVDYGVLVARGVTPSDLAVIPGSPADQAGIVENDIILEIDGVKLDADKSFSYLIRQKAVGDVVELTILSKGDKKTVTVVLEKAPELNLD